MYLFSLFIYLLIQDNELLHKVIEKIKAEKE